MENISENFTGSEIYGIPSVNCEILGIETRGFASDHGYTSNNNTLCNRRRKFIEKMTSSLSSVISQIVETQKQFMTAIVEAMNQNIFPAFKDLSLSLEEARNNPDSLLSWMNYYNKLSEFFWIMPYKITTEELHEILQNVKTEKEFDQYISKYFNKSKVESLIKDIRNMLSNNNQRKILLIHKIQ